MRIRPLALVLAAAIAPAAALASAAPAAAVLRAGAGRADVTPPKTGYYLGGWTRADRLARGQHTRLFARAIVLQQGQRKVALVALDLFMVPAGLQKQAAELAGFGEDTVLISATHTHSGPGGFAPFSTYNTAAPSVETIGNPASFVELFSPKPADKQLYGFLAHQIAAAIRRANADLGPAAAGWAQDRIVGLTRNRSLEAHLADHGIVKRVGTGRPQDDPDGAEHTIAPDVDVLRVDKLRSKRKCGKRSRRTGRRRCRRVRVHVPIGGWADFANHGTVTKAEFGAYDADHHGSAHRVFEQRVRAAGKVPAGQEVVNVYGNGEEGDQSAGLDFTGPAGADEVGRVEAAHMLAAWRRAGASLSRSIALDSRWTRQCFCGRPTSQGPVASSGQPGVPFFTGSEEGRGPLYDLTKVSFENRTSPNDDVSQGHKIGLPVGGFPTAVPLMVVRLGDRVIASLPGEPTKEVGARTKQAVLAATASVGIRKVVIAGLANEYLSYITTPEEYQQQHYEGGSTLYGPRESVFLWERQAELAGALARGEPAPKPFPFDPTNGISPDGPAYGMGVAEGRLTDEPAARVGRLEHARIAWQGGANGADKPIDAPFVVVERRESGGVWRAVDSDLGLAILWRVDSQGRYTAVWEVPFDAPLGEHRLVVRASRYTLTSRPFTVGASGALIVRKVDTDSGRLAVSLAYPLARENVDLTYRPRLAAGGSVKFRVGGRDVEVASRGDSVFAVPAPGGEAVEIPAGAGRDRFGNANAAALKLR